MTPDRQKKFMWKVYDLATGGPRSIASEYIHWYQEPWYTTTDDVVIAVRDLREIIGNSLLTHLHRAMGT